MFSPWTPAVWCTVFLLSAIIPPKNQWISQNSTPKKIGMSKVKVAINHSGWILFYLIVFFLSCHVQISKCPNWEPFKHRSQQNMGWKANTVRWIQKGKIIKHLLTVLHSKYGTPNKKNMGSPNFGNVKKNELNEWHGILKTKKNAWFSSCPPARLNGDAFAKRFPKAWIPPRPRQSMPFTVLRQQWFISPKENFISEGGEVD